MCLQTALTGASIGLKVVEGVQANKAAKREAAIGESQAALARQTAAANAQRRFRREPYWASTRRAD